MTTYNKKLGAEICKLVATTSEGLNYICFKLHLPYSTVASWVYNRNHDLYLKYKDAKQMQLQHLYDEILNIADNDIRDMVSTIRGGRAFQVPNPEAVNRSKVRIQARQWMLARLAPVTRDEAPERAQIKVTIIKAQPLPPAAETRQIEEHH